jgi:hypothetical protein
MEIITSTELASYLGDAALATDNRLQLIVDLTNDLVSEKWSKATTPVPASVRLLALAVASRAWRSDPSKAALQSVTRSIDDASRTERYAVSSEKVGVFLTDAEETQLRGRRNRVRSIRLKVPGY